MNGGQRIPFGPSSPLQIGGFPIDYNNNTSMHRDEDESMTTRKAKSRIA